MRALARDVPSVPPWPAPNLAASEKVCRAVAHSLELRYEAQWKSKTRKREFDGELRPAGGRRMQHDQPWLLCTIVVFILVQP